MLHMKSVGAVCVQHAGCEQPIAADEHDVSERICLDLQLRERVKWKNHSSLVVVGFDRHFGELRLGEGATSRGRQGGKICGE